jgi:hypothetical protein
MNPKWKRLLRVVAVVIVAALLGAPQGLVLADDRPAYCPVPNNWDGQTCWAPCPEGTQWNGSVCVSQPEQLPPPGATMVPNESQLLGNYQFGQHAYTPLAGEVSMQEFGSQSGIYDYRRLPANQWYREDPYSGDPAVGTPRWDMWGGGYSATLTNCSPYTWVVWETVRCSGWQLWWSPPGPTHFGP